MDGATGMCYPCVLEYEAGCPSLPTSGPDTLSYELDGETVTENYVSPVLAHAAFARARYTKCRLLIRS